MTCRHRTDGKLCRRSLRHAAHQDHGTDCSVPAELHHAFVTARPYGAVPKKRQESDPFVRTSMLFRRSDLTYLTTKYRSAVAALREWIATDRGLRGEARRLHIPAPNVMARRAGGKFVPRSAMVVEDEEPMGVVIVEGEDDHFAWAPPQQEVSDSERAAVIADMEERIAQPGPVGHVPPGHVPPDDDEDLVL